MRDANEIGQLLDEAERELTRLDSQKAELLVQIAELQREKASSLHVQGVILPTSKSSSVTNQSSQEAKIAIFRSLFRGREDVYPKRFESQKTGKKGYQPDCRNEWVKGVCQKPNTKCDACVDRDLLPVMDDVVRKHLLGKDPNTGRDFTMGVYPMLRDETCWFLAADFDKLSWRDDIKAFMGTCMRFNVPIAMERSRSGNGGHSWIFFSAAIPAALARKMGAFLLTQTMEYRPEIG